MPVVAGTIAAMSTIERVRSEGTRLVKAAAHSGDGIAAAYQVERAFRLEVWVSALMLPAAFWLGRGWVQIALLAGSVWMVMIVELVNSAIEAVVDRQSLEWHELAKRAKDVGSAAVLMALLLCACIWGAALVERFG